MKHEERVEKKVEGLEVRLRIGGVYVYAGTHPRLSIPCGEINAARSSRKRGAVGSSRGGFEIQVAEVLSCEIPSRFPPVVSLSTHAGFCAEGRSAAP